MGAKRKQARVSHKQSFSGLLSEALCRLATLYVNGVH